MKPIFPPVDVDTSLRSAAEWEADWARILSLANPKSIMSDRPSQSFTPGSLEGVWEGIFTVRFFFFLNVFSLVCRGYLLPSPIYMCVYSRI
jgi:hypothetical protein